MKRIILCADDYGQNSAISQAIIELFEKNRLTATSCMTNSYYWSTHSKWLNPYIDKVDIGIHLNLTEGKALSKGFSSGFMPLSQLIMKSYLRRLDQAAIEMEFHAQLDQFVNALGREPDFVDGHQHIHQLPVIRDAFFKVYEKRLRNSGCYVRSVNDPSMLRYKDRAFLKKLIIQLCGSFAFKKELVKLNIPHNTSFSGVYDFVNARQYSLIFPQFLQQINDQGLIMCHPGLSELNGEDPIADSRFFEFQYFLSDKFLEDCSLLQVSLGRFK